MATVTGSISTGQIAKKAVSGRSEAVSLDLNHSVKSSLPL